LSSEYTIVETEGFRRLSAKKEWSRLCSRVRSYVYPQLRVNPFYGPNIKKLKGAYSDYYRYRIGDYRLFYFVDGKQLCVVVVTLRHRREAYR
jgi:mRNA interferase RelE/StbE